MPNKKLAKRCTLIIDKNGVIAKIYAMVGNAGGHPAEVLDFVEKNLKH